MDNINNPIQKEEARASEPVLPAKISFNEFSKIEVKIGKILSAEKVPETEKLVKLSVDFAESMPRQIISGIAKYFPDVSVLVGKKCPFVTNLEPRIIKGQESNGMIMAVSGGEGETMRFSLLEALGDILPGDKVV